MSIEAFYQDIEDFHRRFGLGPEEPGVPRALEDELAEFRYNFIEEEAAEWLDANTMQTSSSLLTPEEVKTELVSQLDGIVDMLYVVLGTAHMQGFTAEHINEAWRRVHDANMKKVRAQAAEDSKRMSKFDVVKPEGWTPPNLADIF